MSVLQGILPALITEDWALYISGIGTEWHFYFQGQKLHFGNVCEEKMSFTSFVEAESFLSLFSVIICNDDNFQPLWRLFIDAFGVCVCVFTVVFLLDPISAKSIKRGKKSKKVAPSGGDTAWRGPDQTRHRGGLAVQTDSAAQTKSCAVCLWRTCV